MKKKKVRLRKWLVILLISIFGFGLLYSSISLILRQVSLDKNNKIKEEIKQNVTVITEKKHDEETGKEIIEEQYVVDFNSLKQQNSDTVAYLKIKNSDIEYAVVKANDNDYYLTHNFKKQYNTAGWIFADYKNKFDGTDKNIVIYGHSMKDESMFGSLYRIFNSEWLNNSDNLDIIFNTADGDHIYRIFSMYRIEAEDYYITTNFSSDKELDTFIKTLKSRSSRNFNTSVDGSDQIITLSTCTSDLSKRIAVHAKKIS